MNDFANEPDVSRMIIYMANPPNCVIKQLILDGRNYVQHKDNSFRGGSIKKGGKTKYRRS